VRNEAEVGLAGASVGAGGRCTPHLMLFIAQLQQKNNLNVRECAKLWFLKKQRERREEKIKGK